MSGINKAIILGRLGQDPELKYTSSGKAVCLLSVATSDEWTDKQGQKQERVEWHRVIIWDKLAEISNQYLSKGRQVYIEGKIQTRSWEDSGGDKKYTTEVIANTVQFLGDQSSQQKKKGDEDKGKSVETNQDFTGDDIPF
jgi:single-strand DNA-binding protein